MRLTLFAAAVLGSSALCFTGGCADKNKEESINGKMNTDTRDNRGDNYRPMTDTNGQYQNIKNNDNSGTTSGVNH